MPIHEQDCCKMMVVFLHNQTESGGFVLVCVQNSEHVTSRGGKNPAHAWPNNHCRRGQEW
jgi:hypothetical protein